MYETKSINEVKVLRQKSLCCPDSEIIKVRTVFKHSETAPTNLMRAFSASRQEVISYKALIKRSGRGREFEFKRIGTVASNSPILQGIQAVGSAFTPGNLSMIRSPIRSTLSRTLTPGIPGIPGMRRDAGDGVSRCPEGYQYGGRFTDNRFSTCGQRLFAIPGPIGAAIGAVRRIARALNPPVADVVAKPLGEGQYGDSIVEQRAPQIPKVSMSNPQKALAEIKKLVKPLGSTRDSYARMVRRDGFVVEPVVPPSVLRTIPDNRDMEGATYMLNVSNPDIIGKDELGLLSNTGVASLKYVLPGGSVLTLEKRRQLTVGERRKLGRTVNAAIDSDNSKDPASRLKMVAQETGEGIGYSESFVGISRPNEIGNDGRQRWASLGFKKRVAKATEEVSEPKQRQSESVAPVGKDIRTLAGAVAHIQRGGSLTEIAPDILQQALAKVSQIKKDGIGSGRTMLTMPNGDKYMQRTSNVDFEAISQRFISGVQQHLAIEAPNVLLLGPGNRRPYLVEDAATALKGSKIKPDAGFGSAPWTEVTKLLISDILTDVSNRNSGSVELADYNGKTKLMPVENIGGGLVDLSKISIRERTEAQLNDLLTVGNSKLYLDYFKQLKEAQRAQYLQFIATLIQRARAFNLSQFKSRLYTDGKLTQGEKIHLNILETLYSTRLEKLVQQNDSLSALISGR